MLKKADENGGMRGTDMKLKEKFKEVRNNYVINQVAGIKMPQFEADVMRRYRIRFSGRVQKVGFRMEVYELAKRLGLTGYCRNLENGDVLAELQGEKNRIRFLVSYMERLKRIHIRKKVVKRMHLNAAEKEFLKP